MSNMQSLELAGTQKVDTITDRSGPDLDINPQIVLRGNGDATSGTAELTIQEPESELLTENDRMQE